ncbi:PQQ-binding-like beta-propeller repeat protein [Halohasta salina]|uniref:outer membrane protein assembly factor BamB family protein n=1 Tax=Halohasta salina TaxID=2961621 RepID=UPI002AA29DF7|nr:PQQ-binding-like beta-propeller repeat protein [Halohasta salina]
MASTLAGCSSIGDTEETAPLYTGNWHSFGNGPRNTNQVQGGTPKPQRHEPLTSAGWIYTPPVVHDDIVYFATDREVVALDTAGTQQWTHQLDHEVSGAPCLDPDRRRLYVPTQITGSTDEVSQRATLHVLSLSEGELLEAYRVGTEKTYGATVVDGDIFIRSDSACLRLAADGTERWRQSLEPLVYDEYNLGDSTATQIVPAVDEEGVYIPDSDAIVKLDREGGDERFRLSVDTPYAAPTVDDGGIIQTGWQETIAVTPSGDVRWRRDLQSRAAAAASDDEIYVISDDLHCLTADTGSTKWHTHLPSEGTAAPVVTDDSVIVVSGDVRAFRRDTNGRRSDDRTQWEYTDVHAAEYASPVVAAGRIFVSGPVGLLALDPEGER